MDLRGTEVPRILGLGKHKTDDEDLVPRPPSPPRKLNIIHLNTDDQANLLGDMEDMAFFNENVAKHGVLLHNYYTNTPICCPSRATTLSGRCVPLWRPSPLPWNPVFSLVVPPL